jgi:predicted nucleotidyltransferase
VSEEEPKVVVDDLVSSIVATLADDVLGVYLYGSLAAGAFVPAQSDIDLIVVLRGSAEDEPKLATLRTLHDRFVVSWPDWANRIDVGYVAAGDLRTLTLPPQGNAAVVSDNEPLHVKPLDREWLINWYEAATMGEVLFGESPSDVGRQIPVTEFKKAVAEQLEEWRAEIRSPWIAHSRKYQGYIVLTVCRGLYALDHGTQTTKEGAALWAGSRYPEWREFISEALAWQRGDISEPYNTTVRFVDAVIDSRPANS